MKRIALIMAGGSGERFWPLSRRNHPKQLLNLNNPDKSMLQEAIDRIAPLIPKEDIFIITSEILARNIRLSVPDFPPENVIPEPSKRNTAPCLALGAAIALAKYEADGVSPKDISIAVLTADQAIEPESGFLATVDAAMSYAETHDALVTIGIVPDRPETGYGYIETAEQFTKNNEPQIAKVLSFREKPKAEAAEKYLTSGKFLWNSGMFFWRADVFISEMKKYLPEVGENIQAMTELSKVKLSKPQSSFRSALGGTFDACPSISIDFGLMEKSSKVAVAKALFNWDDVGAWDALKRSHQADASGNIDIGDNSLVETTNSIILNESKGKIIASVIGMDNVTVVVTGDAVLICPTDKVQDVKKSVEDIRTRFGGKWI